MKRLGWLLLAAVLVAGVFSGPSMRASSAASQPPLAWGDLASVAGFACLALPALLGLQVLLGNLNALRLGWVIFGYIGAYFVAAGLAALAIAWRGPDVAAGDLLFVVLGLSMLGGLGLVRIAFRRQFARR